MQKIILVKKYLLISICIVGVSIANHCYASEKQKHDKLNEWQEEVIEVYEEAKKISCSRGSINIYSELVNRLMNNNISKEVAYKMIENRSPEALQIRTEIIHEIVIENLEEARKIVKNRKRNE